MDAHDERTVRQLFDDYLRMYAGRDDRLTTFFSEDFSGFTGGGDFLVKDREQWIAITRQDFAQVRDPIRIELKDLALQSLADTVAVATGFFVIHLPIPDHILSRETARLVLIFRKESAGWKICHSGISIPYYGVREDEVYPLKDLLDRNQQLEAVIEDRTRQLSEANAELQRNEDLYRSILNASPDDITITDSEGRIVMVSPKGLTMFGYPESSAFLGRPVTDFIVPEDRERARSRIALGQQGVSTGSTEYRGLRHDGSTFDIEVNSEIIRDVEGRPTGMVFIARDITARKQMEATTRQLQKSESLGRMAGAIAHRFNNLLGAVVANLELAEVELAEGVPPHRRITEAMRASQQAAEVSGQMLTYLGQSFDVREPLDLAESCRGILSILRVVVPAHVDLETDLPSPGPVISVNANEIQQVVTNLVANAQEAGGEGPGTIHLRVHGVATTEIPTLHRFPRDWNPQNPAYACLEVRDAGCGIERDDIEKLFDPFFSTKFTGRGMGLAVVLGIAKAHGGGVTVGSAPGRGSVFRVFFPVSAGSAPRLESPAASTPVTPGTGTILLVEDEEMVRTAAARVLTHLGYTVLEAADGVAALEVFRQRRGDIRGVVCDLTMPRLNGWETLKALRALDPDIPVILASGYDEAHVMSGEHPELPQAFLHKPYRSADLRAALASALRRD